MTNTKVNLVMQVQGASMMSEGDAQALNNFEHFQITLTRKGKPDEILEVAVRGNYPASQRIALSDEFYYAAISDACPSWAKTMVTKKLPNGKTLKFPEWTILSKKERLKRSIAHLVASLGGTKFSFSVVED
jgi:hypothetical protein